MSQRPYHHGDLRAVLLAGAERVLREKGSANLSLRQISRDIGVSHAASARHFSNKQARAPAGGWPTADVLTKAAIKTAADSGAEAQAEAGCAAQGKSAEGTGEPETVSAG